MESDKCFEVIAVLGPKGMILKSHNIDLSGNYTPFKAQRKMRPPLDFTEIFGNYRLIANALGVPETYTHPAGVDYLERISYGAVEGTNGEGREEWGEPILSRCFFTPGGSGTQNRYNTL